ncbi:MAG: hypothetical protein ACPGO3_05600 [Magnetospiraceae bacterium]
MSTSTSQAGRPRSEIAFNPRSVSPREATRLALALYRDGALDHGEYILLASQSDLHPEFNRTIGALLGIRARPDFPRDLVAAWEDRVRLERSHGRPDAPVRRRSERILAVLRLIDQPIEMQA